MRLWRISNYTDLLGVGGMVASARWHTAGKPVVYLAEVPAAALLEALVHLELDEAHLPATYQLLKVEADATITSQGIDPLALTDTWREDAAQTQALGDAWLRSGDTALLRAPSAITPETWNWLLNPRHPQATLVRIVSAERWPYDSRLFRS